MAGPRLLVPAPMFTPSQYGLLSVAQPATPDNAHWQNGVTWPANCIDADTTYEECITVTGTGSPPAAPTLPSSTDFSYRGATPFTIFARFNCSPVGNDVNALAEEALRNMGSVQVEKAFWSGTAGGQSTVFPHLAASVTVTGSDNIMLQTAPVTGAADDAAAALGYLEGQLGTCYNGQGVIHVPASAAATFFARELFEDIGGKLYTGKGNLVVIGNGYPGTSPTGAAASAGTAWVYATGAIMEMHGPVRARTLTETLDRSENTINAIAEQTYLIAWDGCCHAGVQVTLGVPT